MDILKLHREIQILDVHFVSILPELDGGRDVDTVSGEPVIRRRCSPMFPRLAFLPYLSSPVEKPRSRLGGMEPDIL